MKDGTMTHRELKRGEFAVVTVHSTYNGGFWAAYLHDNHIGGKGELETVFFSEDRRHPKKVVQESSHDDLIVFSPKEAVKVFHDFGWSVAEVLAELRKLQ